MAPHRTVRTVRTVLAARAFTLIELLVVVAVIAGLASMLMGAINITRNAAKGARCLSNLHQISLASSAYSTDNNGYLVPNYGINPDGTNNPRYTDFLFPYMTMNSGSTNTQLKNIYVCPSGRPMRNLNGWLWYWNYGMNYALHPDFWTPDWNSRNIAQVVRPSEVLDVADACQPASDTVGNSSLVIRCWNDWSTNRGYYDADGSWANAMAGSTPDEAGGSVIRYRHGSPGYNGQRANVAWADGHGSAVGHQVLIKADNFMASLVP